MQIFVMASKAVRGFKAFSLHNNNNHGAEITAAQAKTWLALDPPDASDSIRSAVS